MFVKTPVYDVNGAVVFGLMREAVVPHASDRTITVTTGMGSRLDLLANSLYRLPYLWWVLAQVNNIPDPLTGIPDGTVIRVPLLQRLASEGILNK